MDILDILLDILLKPPQPFIGLFLFKITPRFPPTVYLFQPGLTHVVHGKLPGFALTPPVYKI